MKKSTNVAVHLISAAILLVDFLLCRYLFFDLHGMKDWPVFMLGLGIAVLVISFLLKGQHLPLISATHQEKGEEVLNLLMLDDKIPAGAKMC